MKTISRILFEDLESTPQFIKDFLQTKVSGYEGFLPTDENFKTRIKAKKQSFSKEKRQLLHLVLSEQMQNLTTTPAQNLHLESLLSEDCFSVVTGHQLNLFTGPVYFIYKILQCIKTADELKKKFPHQHFVPIFWMATEDHDFDEVKFFRTESAYFEAQGQAKGAVGRMPVNQGFFIDEFEQEIKDHVYGTELILWMQDAYRSGNSFAQATQRLVQHLFSSYGLLILNGDDARLKQEMINVFEGDLLEHQLYKKTSEHISALKNKYGKVQVNPREINLFYLSDTRNRIENEGDGFRMVDTNIKFSKEDLLQELKQHPEKFSPNAIMRPVYQESILPNIAYIGGNAEIQYWLELKDFFDELELPFPILIPRNSFLYLSEKVVQKCKKLDLKVDDFFGNFAQLTKKTLLKNNELLNLLNEKEQEVGFIFQELKDKASTTELTFGNLVQAEEKRQLKSFDRMKKRLLRAEKIKQKEWLDRMEYLFLEIHPGKQWQERIYNFSVFYAHFGPQWLDFCYNTLNVEKSELIISEI